MKSIRDKATETILSLWSWWWSDSNKRSTDEIAAAAFTICLAVLAFLWHRHRSRKGTAAPWPPGPRGLPILGYLPFLGSNLHHSFAELAHLYGPIFKLWLGNKLCVVMSSPSLAKEVRDQDTIFANRDPPVAAYAYTYGGLDIGWSPYGSYWRNLRKVFVREMLSNASLKACHPFQRSEVRKMTASVYSRIGTPVDIGELSFQTVVNVTVSSLWGNTPEVHNGSANIAEFRKAASEITELLGKPNISDFFPTLAKFDIQGVERQTKRAFHIAERVIDSIIDLKMKKGSANEEGASDNGKKKDFLQFLLDLKEREDTETVPLTMTQIKALLMDILVGGTDTTSTMVEWLMAEMIRNPAIMKRAQEEVTNVVGMGNVVEESHLPQLQYLDAVIKESLRLHPPLPLLLPRCPSQDCTVGGYAILKGTKVFLNVWAIHRDPQLWDNPTDFEPERFLSEPGRWDNTGSSFQYLPFGSGRRICAGILLGERMMSYLLASLLHSFNWELPEGDDQLDLSEKFGIVLKKRTPLVAVPSRRLSSSDLYLESFELKD